MTAALSRLDHYLSILLKKQSSGFSSCRDVTSSIFQGLESIGGTNKLDPFPFLFANPACSPLTQQTVWPHENSQLLEVDQALDSTEHLWQSPGFPVQSFYIPFNYDVYYSTENNGHAPQKISGPYLGVDNNDNPLSGAVFVRFVAKKPWDLYKRDLCFGIDYNVGQHSLLGSPSFPLHPPDLTQAEDVSQACDAYIKNEYCTGAYANAADCSCILDEARLKQEYPNSTLSVVCNGILCEHNNGYKTHKELSTACSPAVCGKIVQDNIDSLSAQGVSKIYCNSNYVDVPSTSDAGSDSVSVSPTVSLESPSLPLPVWALCVICVGGMLLLVLFVLLYRYSNIKNT